MAANIGNGNGKNGNKVNFTTAIETLLNSMDKVVTSKTVVGEAVKIEDTVIIPLIDIQFGCGVGVNSGEKKDKGTGGLGGKITPSSVLVIKNGTTRIINIKNQDTMTKLLDMVPDVLDRLKERKEDKVTEEDIDDMLDIGL
jgi:uncharacterized spore protein YtfJ